MEHRETAALMWKTLWKIRGVGAYKLMNIWESIQDYLQPKVSSESYENWLKSTSFLLTDGDTLLVAVPDRATTTWLETEMAGMVQSGIRALGLPIRYVRYEVQPARSSPRQTMAAAEMNEPESAMNSLNPKFTFDTFVVGACNQFAHAAAHSVATKPSRSYNPLFLYGGVGMGKTHLMHAIGRELMRQATIPCG